MADEQTRQMDLRCCTCGEPGEIVTCSRCKEIREHIYCMRICPESIEDWYCNECELRAEDAQESSPRGGLPRKSQLVNSGTVSHDAKQSLKSRKLLNEKRRGPARWENRVASGRTKYIPVNEALKLSSGIPIAQSTKMFTSHSVPAQRKTGVSLPGRSSTRPQPVPMTFSAHRDRSNSASGPSHKLMPKRHDNVEISRPQQQSKEHREVQRPANVVQAAPTPINEQIQKERCAEVRNAVKRLSPAALPSVSLKVQKPENVVQVAPTPINEQIQKEHSAEARNAVKRLSPASLPSVSDPLDISGIANSEKVIEPRTSNAANVDNSILPSMTYADSLNNIVPHLERRISNVGNLVGRLLPNAESRTSSSGNMNGNLPHGIDPTSTVDNVSKSTLLLDVSSSNPALQPLWMGSFIIHNGSTHDAVSDQMKAYPPGRVRRKVYEFSKLMPKVLHFDMFPCRELWTNLFQEYRPDGKSIGLYFLPSVCERSEEYFSLVVSMMKKDLALRKQIGDVELLLFPSTCLTSDCQRWDDKYFLWGLFRRVKGDAVDRALTLSPRPSNCGHNGEDNNEPIDMEIDMIGDVIVGPVDIVVRDRRGSSKDPIAATLLHGNVDSFKRDCVLDVKREQCADYPPGFEQVHLPRVWNLPRLLENYGANGGERDK